MVKRVPEEFLVVERVNKSYPGGRLPALKEVSLSLCRGETAVLLGPSGSGKSTLLRSICGLEEVDSGRIAIGGRTVTENPREREALRPELGMVFQAFNLFPHLTVMENLVLAPLKVRRRPRGEAKEEARRLLERVGLADKAGARPSQLSGGQQQRVAIARALAMNPKMMLFDEPTSALDPEMTGEVLAVMKALSDEGLTMLVVTHEIGFAREAGDSLIFMDEGEIVERGPARGFFENPATERARQFLDKIIT